MQTESISDLSPKQKAETLNVLASGPLKSSVSKLYGSSRGIPSEKDFHFFNNFNEFKVPVKEIAEKSESLLKSIGSSSRFLFGKPLIFPEDSEDAYEWLVNMNDEVLERIDVSMDEFKRLKKKEEETGVGCLDPEGEFQLVYGKKKKGIMRNLERNEERGLGSSTMAKIASKDQKTGRSRVPFHIPSITRPQDEFNILVNNANQPFEHVWLQRREDGSRFLHPLENLSQSDFVDQNIVDVQPVKPLSLESTPFELVERVKELKELAAKLRDVNEFAVDLEHNQYRSFQGLTCLMQISTRTEDFVVDTLKLRVHVGPYLREVFKDPSKRKVMHGADRDILWLQRDFGIYVCNLFDTGQASRVLQLERNSLEYLLHHFCGVTANKEYQNADWRLRPLPDEMIKYAREDTHYLLYIYDLMRDMLLSASTDSVNTLLLEVYKRSYDICMQLYEKELLTDTSYLHIYGLQDADFNSQQLAVVAGLFGWRDFVARAEDESTGYILPNKAVLEIARHMPATSNKLRRLVKAKHPFVERNLGSVIGIISSSIENAAAFESALELLKKGREDSEPEQNMEAMPENSKDVPVLEDPISIETVSSQAKGLNDVFYSSIVQTAEYMKTSGNVEEKSLEQVSASISPFETVKSPITPKVTGCFTEARHSFRPGQMSNANTEAETLHPVSVASVQMLKKPSRAFGALLGNSTSKRKLNADPGGSSLEQNKAEIKVEQIKSSVALPFHSFLGPSEPSKPIADEGIKFPDLQETIHKCNDEPDVVSKLEEIIPLEMDSNVVAKLEEIIPLEKDSNDLESDDGARLGESDMFEEPMSLTDLSSSFKECVRSINETRNLKQMGKRSEESDNCTQVEIFDYAAAREEMRFGEEREGLRGGDHKKPSDSREKRKGSVSARIPSAGNEFQQPRRRQAFPASGNRSATFR
ncbi:polynucleotidyl transferase, ribonuclease H fold protein with HRDC domain-containing protein isoform X2 [Tasmannia lanceolata]|uniref:polynucleotidyl transferase, ribonuclease H fold protein with HRDC domain-containing protein isoform X2 n=1 Tax=Tasmannia lanceolata TaxID=3420 RepID=UPI004064BE9D